VAGQEILSYKVFDQVSVTQNNGTPDQTFDFAGRVNILVGFETKLTSKLLMHIEPYAKIPTSGQAPTNLNHTSTGINFKISF
jgi:tRNA G18 (ribose-2'-O)-methylase SpoU